MYKISKEVKEILSTYDKSVEVLFTHYLEEYMETGKNPNLWAVELKDLWFYLKVHELSDQLQKTSTGFNAINGTFAYLELQSLLVKNCKKFANRSFRVGGYHNGTC